jgi:hypothetical protein
VVVADELTAEQPLTTAWRSQSSAIEFGYSGETKSFESLRREEKKAAFFLATSVETALT